MTTYSDNYLLLKEVEEKRLLLKMANFDDVIKRAAEGYKPHLLARWVLEFAQLFNTYYQKHKMIQENQKLQDVRLLLVG